MSPSESSQSTDTPPASHRLMRWLVWSAVIGLALLHQDFWYWEDKRLLFGFLPTGLTYHIGFSLVAAGLWRVALSYVWPTEWEAWAEEEVQDGEDLARK